MKKYFTHLLALVACLVCSANAHAQFSASFEQEPVGYKALQQAFPIADIAAAMDVDANELGQALLTWMETEGETETNYFFLKEGDTLYSDYTQGGKGGFWMTKNPATPVAWTGEVGDDAWYNILSVDEEVANLIIQVGQHPDAFTAGEEVSAQFVLQYAGKQATFDITLTIIEKEETVLPDPVTDITALTIVGERTITWEQYPNIAMAQKTDLTGVADLLGTTDDVIAENLNRFLFIPTIEIRDEKPYKTNTLTNESSAGGLGWWMAAVWSDELEAFSNECARCFWGEHAAFRSMYDEQYAYDANTYQLSSVTGFENYTLELGTSYTYDYYLVYGEKAVVLHHTITLTQKPEEDPDKWIKISEEEQSVSIVQGNMTAQLNLDLDAIAATLDCDPTELSVYGPDDTKGNISDRQTANNGGFWFSSAGVVCSWGGQDTEGNTFTFFMEPVTYGDFSAWNIGQNAAQTAVGDTYTTTLFFFNGDKSDTNNKYYAVNVTIIIKEEEPLEVEFVSVATKNIVYRVEPRGDSYGPDNIPGIDLNEMAELIDTTSPTLYGWVKTEDGKDYSKSYSCTPYPGFWLDSEGFVSVWTSATDSPFAFCYLADGSFDLYQFPGANAAGTTRKTTFFLVNETTGKLITVNIAIAFGDVVNYEDAGSQEEMLIADPDSDHEVLEIDMADAVEKMGVEDVSTLLSGQCIAVLTSDGTWSDPQLAEVISVDAQGYFTTEDAAFEIYITPGSETFAEFTVDNLNNVEIPADFSLTVKMAIQREVDGDLKQYFITVTIVSQETYTGIQTVKQTADATIYDLSGRRTDANRKGVYIVNGKKVVK